MQVGAFGLSADAAKRFEMAAEGASAAQLNQVFAIQQVVQAQRDQAAIDTFGMNARDAAILTMQNALMREQNPILKAQIEAELARAIAQDARLDALEAERDLQKEILGVVNQNRTPLENMRQQFERLAFLADNGLDMEQYGRGIEQAFNRMGQGQGQDREVKLAGVVTKDSAAAISAINQAKVQGPEQSVQEQMEATLRRQLVLEEEAGVRQQAMLTALERIRDEHPELAHLVTR